MKTTRTAASLLALVAFSTLQSLAPAEVLTGLDVLEQNEFKDLQGRKVAIVTNNTGLNSKGRHIVDLLTHAKGVTVVKLLAPEHGIYGLKDEKLTDSVDEKSGLPVLSLYGKTMKPTDEMLAGIDTLVFDIQDCGARYYTYSATLGYCLEAAARNKIRYVVLDRPNPVTGNLVDGPIQDKEHVGKFTAYGPFPVSHGMTFGELATMYNKEYGINADLHVVKMDGWKRDMWWADTRLPWTNPSPNMRNPTQALLYLATGLMEATNISVGRGTDIPFEHFGAPWIDAKQLANALNAYNLPGLYFTPVTFTPQSTPHKIHLGKVCNGVRIEITDRTKVQPVMSGMTMARTLKKLYGDQYTYDKVNNLLMNKSITDKVETMEDPRDSAKLWQKDVEQFKKTRAKYLLYK